MGGCDIRWGHHLWWGVSEPVVLELQNGKATGLVRNVPSFLASLSSTAVCFVLPPPLATPYPWHAPNIGTAWCNPYLPACRVFFLGLLPLGSSRTALQCLPLDWDVRQVDVPESITFIDVGAFLRQPVAAYGSAHLAFVANLWTPFGKPSEGIPGNNGPAGAEPGKFFLPIAPVIFDHFVPKPHDPGNMGEVHFTPSRKVEPEP